jgi:hypothetical protein
MCVGFLCQGFEIGRTGTHGCSHKDGIGNRYINLQDRYTPSMEALTPPLSTHSKHTSGRKHKYQNLFHIVGTGKWLKELHTPIAIVLALSTTEEMKTTLWALAFLVAFSAPALSQIVSNQRVTIKGYVSPLGVSIHAQTIVPLHPALPVRWRAYRAAAIPDVHLIVTSTIY